MAGPKWISPNQAADLKTNINWTPQKRRWNTFCNTWKWPKVFCRFYISFECWFYGYSAALALGPVKWPMSGVHKMATCISWQRCRWNWWGRASGSVFDWRRSDTEHQLLHAWVWPVQLGVKESFMQARRKARRASWEWKTDTEWRLGRPRDFRKKTQCCPALTYQLNPTDVYTAWRDCL